MGEIGFDKILLLLVIVLLLFGAKRLPEFGRSLGKGIREFKGSLSGVKDAISEPAPQDRVTEGQQPPAAAAKPDDQATREPRRLIS
jgi:sec-independent protein translocase protein TatA